MSEQLGFWEETDRPGTPTSFTPAVDTSDGSRVFELVDAQPIAGTGVNKMVSIRLRDEAEKLEGRIDQASVSLRDALYALSDAHGDGSMPESLSKIVRKSQVDSILFGIKYWFSEEYAASRFLGQHWKRLQAAGIETEADFYQAVEDFKALIDHG